MDESKQIDPKIEKLLSKFEKCRDELSAFIDEIEDAAKHIKELFPKNIDFRNSRYLFEDRLKTVTSLYAVLLNWRQEYIKSIKDEIDIRRRILTSDDDKQVDIREIAERIEKLKNVTNNMILPTYEEKGTEDDGADKSDTGS